MSSSQPSGPPGLTGSCSVCGRHGLRVIDGTGLLWKHGPQGHSCAGSHTLPAPVQLRPSAGAARPSDTSGSGSHPLVLGGHPFDNSLDLFDASRSACSQDTQGAGAGSFDTHTHDNLYSSTLAPPFLPPYSSGKILKRIPKGARDAAAECFTQTLDSVLNAPEDRAAWTSLFGFAAGCFGVRTERGGKSRNLTTTICKQIQRFKEVGWTVTDCQEAPPVHRKSKRAPLSSDAAAAKRASAKLDEGDIKGSIRQLCSTDTLADASATTYQQLQLKHPPAPNDRRSPYTALPAAPYDPFLTSADQVLSAIKSFPPGSSGGPDGLRPQHLKDMSEKQVGGKLSISLMNFVNFVMAGQIPLWVRPHFFGATLLAFTKKDGGVRPIAVGTALRRLAAKVACRSVTEECLHYLKPRQ
jgi:hypothetical protein